MTETTDERLARGRQVAAQLFKPPSPALSFKYPPEIAADWGQLSVATVFGDVWSRPGLDLKQRSMLNIAALTVLNKPEQLRAYLIGALNLGVTREEVCEIILQMAIYAGFPTAIQGFAIAAQVFEEVDALRQESAT